jgi:hypothetical protein
MTTKLVTMQGHDDSFHHEPIGAPVFPHNAQPVQEDHGRPLSIEHSYCPVSKSEYWTVKWSDNQTTFIYEREQAEKLARGLFCIY